MQKYSRSPEQVRCLNAATLEHGSIKKRCHGLDAGVFQASFAKATFGDIEITVRGSRHGCVIMNAARKNELRRGRCDL
jgi:hypothetical protein